MPDVTPETKELFAKLHMNMATSEDLVAWAVSLLEEGIETKNVSILASLGKPLYPSEVDDYFRRSLKDLGWSFPESEDCLREFMRDTAAKILRNEISPFKGCEQIYQAVRGLDYPGDLIGWSCLYWGHDPHSYQDLSDDEFDASVRREAKLLAG
jgi:hypothetical protein